MRENVLLVLKEIFLILKIGVLPDKINDTTNFL